jgi:hypothetical protein
MNKLIRAGADMNIKEERGRTAIDILKREHPDKYKKWIRQTIVKQRCEKLRREDSSAGQDTLPDWNI